MEERIRRLEGVKDANIDFSTGRFILEIHNKQNVDRVVMDSKEIIRRIENHVEVIHHEEKSHGHIHGEENSTKKAILTLITGGVFFLITILFKLHPYAELVLYLISYVLVGGEVLVKAFRNILRGEVFDENFLMVIATIGAFGIGDFAEGAAVMLFYRMGEIFQDLAVSRSRRSISELMDIRPDYANIKSGDELQRISPEEVKAGDIIVVKPGEKIPLDGVIREGSSMLDTSALTGESVPREASAGEEVLGGFINRNGVLEIEVTKEFGESTVARILDLVQNARSKKAKTENFITKFARYYTPVVVITAFVLAVVPPLVLPEAAFTDWLQRALIFLVISCPCALVVSIPLGFFGGIGAASRNGILIKGSNYLEALNSVESVVFDKTGTLTKGVFKVTEIRPEAGFESEIGRAHV